MSERSIAELTVNRRHLVGAGAFMLAAGGAFSVRGSSTLARQATPDAEGATIIVGDVTDFQLDPGGRWAGPFGSVTLTMHPGYFDGEDAWFIRTDSSDQAFAQANGLVYVPLMANALSAEGSHAPLYVVEGGVEGQRTVLSTVPGRSDFTSAFRIHTVTFNGDPALLDSVVAIELAEAGGAITVTPSDIIVNYPVVLWPGSGLAVDTELTAPLAPGPLVSAPDMDARTITFKLHQCFPGSRYIATDTSSSPMAPMMGIVNSAPTQLLLDVGATAPIYVFGNGLVGPGAMGFQPAVFNASAGDPAWSPFWDHYTVVWADPSAAVLLTTEAEIREREAAGDVQVFKGTPDSGGQGFVVNCPAPVLAPTTYDPAQFVQATPVS